MEKLTIKESFFLSLPRGVDVVSHMTKLAEDNNWKGGNFSFIGALSMAEISEYEQHEKKYAKPLKFDHDLEILSLIGNITIKEGKPLIHAHINISFDSGKTCAGGHLLASKVFVTEGRVDIYEESLDRDFDESRGLYVLDE